MGDAADRVERRRAQVRRSVATWRKRHPEREQANNVAKGKKRDAIRRSMEPSALKKYLISLARGRAIKRGLPFSLTPDDIEIPERCPVLGIVLQSGARMMDANASLDRIVPERGYVRGNVAVISWRANCLKRDATAGELEAVAAWMRRTQR